MFDPSLKSGNLARDHCDVTRSTLHSFVYDSIRKEWKHVIKSLVSPKLVRYSKRTSNLKASLIAGYMLAIFGIAPREKNISEHNGRETKISL